MGLEDYRVLLKPKPKKPAFPDTSELSTLISNSVAPARRVTTDEIVSALEAMGFIREDSPAEIGPARLGVLPENETRLTARHRMPSQRREMGEDGEYIVEALVRGHRELNEDAPVFDSLNMRFAICQPEGAAWHFLKLVKRMCDTLPLAVVHGEKTYSPEAFWAFRLRANEQIRTQTALWRSLFEDDGEELAISVDHTWAYFLHRHPELRKGGEGTLAACASTDSEIAVTDVEATLPPVKVRQAVSAKREPRA